MEETNRMRGAGNRMRGDGNRMRGDGNRMRGDGNRMRGDGNRIREDGNRMRGDENRMRGDGNRMRGDGNRFSPDDFYRSNIIITFLSFASILDKRQSSSGFSLAIQDLVFALQRTGDPAGLSNIVPSLERLAEIPVSCHSGNGMATSTPPEMTPMEVGLSPEEVSSSLLSASVKLEQDPSPSPPPGESRSIAAGEKAETSPSEVFPAAPGPEEASAGPTTNPPSLASMGAILEATADCINGLVQYLAKHAPNALFRKDVSLLPQSGLASKYKTSMCRDLAQGRPCPRGSACTFAHSEAELARYRGTPVGGTTPRRTRTPGAVFGTPLNRRAAFAPRTLLPLSTIPPQLLQNRQHAGLAGFPLAPGGYAFPSTPSAPSPGNFIHRPDLFSGSPHGFSPGSFWSGAGGRAPSLVTPPRTRVPVSLLSSQPSSRESAQSAPLSLSQSYPSQPSPASSSFESAVSSSTLNAVTISTQSLIRRNHVVQTQPMPSVESVQMSSHPRASPRLFRSYPSQPSPASSSFESAVSSSTLNAVTISTQSLIRRNHVVQTQPMPSRLAPHSLAALQQLKQEILEKLEEKLTTFSDPSFANEEYESHDSEGVQLAGYCSSLPLSSHTQTSSMCSAAHNLVPPKLSPVYVAKMSHAADVPSTASSSTAFMSAAHPMTSAHLRLAYCSTVDHCHSNPQTSVVAPPASVNDWLDSLLLQESPEYHPWSVSAISSNATSRSMSMDTTPPSTTSLASVDPPRPRFRETDDDDEYIPFQSPLSVSRFGPISKDIIVSNMANVRITRQMTPIQVEASSMSYSSTIASNDTIPTPKIEERPETPSNFDEGLDFSPIGYTAPPSANTTSGRLITVGHGMVDPPELHMSHLDPSGFRPSDPSPLITARDSVVLVDSEKARLNLRTRSPSGETIGAWLNSTAPNHQTARTSGSLSASHSTSSLPAEAITNSFPPAILSPCVDPCEEADGLRNDEDALEEELRMIEVGIREKRKELEWNQYRSTPNSWSVSMPASSRWSQADDLVADWGPPCSSSAPEPPASAGSANMFPGFDWSSTSHSRSNA
ncbi:unnamed protein product, partial [Cyprideis torosa]